MKRILAVWIALMLAMTGMTAWAEAAEALPEADAQVPQTEESAEEAAGELTFGEMTLALPEGWAASQLSPEEWILTNETDGISGSVYHLTALPGMSDIAQSMPREDPKMLENFLIGYTAGTEDGVTRATEAADGISCFCKTSETKDGALASAVALGTATMISLELKGSSVEAADAAMDALVGALSAAAEGLSA